MQYQYTAACVSRTGLSRRTQEDSFLFAGATSSENLRNPNPALTAGGNTAAIQLFAVFDGMGGEQGGQVAARTAAQSLQTTYMTHDPEDDRTRDFLTKAVQTMNRAVFQTGQALSLTRMGTTAAVFHVHRDQFYLCNVGDSRIYRYSGGCLQQLSEDDVIFDPYVKNQSLTQYIGIDPERYCLRSHVKKGTICQGDCFLLCTDGLYNDVSQTEICQTLQSFRHDPSACARRLADLAEANGGSDNCTAVVISFCRKPWWKRFFQTKTKGA